MEEDYIFPVAVVLVLASAAVVFILVPTLALCLRSTGTSNNESPEERAHKARNQQREREAEEEKDRVKSLVESHIEKEGKYCFKKDLRNLGGRLQKYWFEIYLKGKPEEALILTATPKSKGCDLSLNERKTISTLKSLLQELNKHPCVHRVEDLDFIPEGNLVVLIQPAIKEGSLKDWIWRKGKVDSKGFDVSWSEKAYSGGNPLDRGKVITFGKQILKGMRYFESLSFFPRLTHVHTGNIFIVDGVCCIAGHENTMLGYRSRLHKECVQNKCDDIEVVMFGHVIFEMSAGQESSQFIPTKDDYSLVGDDHLREIVTFIFTTDSNSKDGTKFQHSLDEIYKKYFKEGDFQFKNKNFKPEISKEMKGLLDPKKQS